MNSEEKLYKVLVNGRSCHGGDYKYDLPKKLEDGTWKPGKWTKKISKKDIEMCKCGYHLTNNPKSWYSRGAKVYIAEAKGISTWLDDKCVCSQVRLLSEFDTNAGRNNYGNGNSGDYNSGDANSGDYNSGNRNSGYWNSGYRNSGEQNSGDWNSGDWNPGYRNSGDYNLGIANSGYGNSGNRNSGDMNTGDRNSGNRNSGNCNSGNWNSGSHNVGSFNTGTPETVHLFNKPIPYGEYENILFPNYFYHDIHDISENAVAVGYKEAWGKAFEGASKAEIEQTISLPNFDYAVFEEITGITEEMIRKRLEGD